MSQLHSRLTSIMSIALVLFLLGLILLIGVLGKELSAYVKENISFSIVLKDALSTTEIKKMQKQLDALPYIKSTTYISKEQAAKELLKFGCKAVLLKGGHLGGNQMVDVLLMAGRTAPRLYSATKVESRNTHGTGCSLSSAIATLLAQGRSLPEAVDGAKTYVREGIRKGKDIEIGSGHGPLNHFFAPIPMKIKE